MNPLHSLRRLFEEHDVFTVEKAPDLESGTLELDAPAKVRDAVAFRKDPGATVHIVSADGESIQAVTHANRVFVPFALYAGTPDHVEAAIQDRIFALLETLMPKTVSEVTPAQAPFFLKEALHGKPLDAIMANAPTLELLRSKASPEPAPFSYVLESKYVPPGWVYGLPEGRYVGHIVNDIRGRAGEVVIPQEDGSEVPGKRAWVALCAHGIVAACRITSAS